MITFYNLSNGQEDFFLITIEKEENYFINIVIDGGRRGNKCYEMSDLSVLDKIDYIVLTHIDHDHIQGLLKILNGNEHKYKDTVIVYNKFTEGIISYKQAEKFEALIKNREIIVSYKGYQQSKGGIRSDNSEIINRSSIMFLLEYKEIAVLMTGDGYISDIMPYINDLAGGQSLYPIKKLDLIKIPHHGSKSNNLKLDELIDKINCDKFIITNEDSGSVKIEDDLKKALMGKTVYCTKECNKYTGLKVKVQTPIEL